MIHYVLKAVDFSNENIKVQALNQIESEVNAFVKNAQVTAATVYPMMQFDQGTSQMLVGAMVNYEIARR